MNKQKIYSRSQSTASTNLTEAKNGIINWGLFNHSRTDMLRVHRSKASARKLGWNSCELHSLDFLAIRFKPNDVLVACCGDLHFFIAWSEFFNLTRDFGFAMKPDWSHTDRMQNLWAYFLQRVCRLNKLCISFPDEFTEICTDMTTHIIVSLLARFGKSWGHFLDSASYVSRCTLYE